MFRSSYFLVSLGVACIGVAIQSERAWGVPAGLRSVGPDEAELLLGAACPLVGLNPAKVCSTSGITPTCGVMTPSPCGAYSCKLSCYVLEPSVAGGCDKTVGPCSTPQCVAATGAAVACPVRTNTQKTCGGTLWCGCGAPNTTVNCPTMQTYIDYTACP